MSCLSPAERRREKERRAGRRGRSRRGDREPLASLTSGGRRRVQSHNGRARGSLGRARLTGEQSQADVPRAARGGLHAAGSTQPAPRSGAFSRKAGRPQRSSRGRAASGWSLPPRSCRHRGLGQELSPQGSSLARRV